jgi:uncharacterized membrane protein YtjA (UPF0391 family)
MYAEYERMCGSCASFYAAGFLKSTQDLLFGGRMLRWALIFLIVAIVAGILGFAGIMVAAAAIAKLLFYLFLLLFLLSLVLGLVRRA